MDTVRVLFCGTGDAFGSGGRLQSCILVQAPRALFLLDCGATALSGIKGFGMDPSEIRTVFISHLHADHYAGLPFLIKESQASGTRKTPLLIAGPPDLEEHVLKLMPLFFPGSGDPRQGFWPSFQTLVPGVPVEMDNILAVAHPAAHSPLSRPTSLRIECCGKVIAYSGDTEWSELLPLVSRGADLFICEASQYDRPTANHLDYRTLMSHRGELDCRRIVLTHLGADMLGRCCALDLECAGDGMLVEL